LYYPDPDDFPCIAIVVITPQFWLSVVSKAIKYLDGAIVSANVKPVFVL